MLVKLQAREEVTELKAALCMWSHTGSSMSPTFLILGKRSCVHYKTQTLKLWHGSEGSQGALAVVEELRLERA